MWSIFKKKDKPQLPVRTPVLITRLERETLIMLVTKHIAVCKIRGSQKQVEFLIALKERLRYEQTL